MKLLLCTKCKSIFNIDYETKSCECGRTKGKYLDNLNAIYCGAHAKPMGLDNHDMNIYLNKKKYRGLYDIVIDKHIKFWFIEKEDCCKTFIKVKVKEYDK